MARSVSLRRLVLRNGSTACAYWTTANARVQSVPHRQRSKPQASNTRASGSQMSGKGYGSRDSVQAPLTLITAFGRLASDQPGARVQVVPEQDIDRKIVASGRAGDPVETRVVRRAVRLLCQHDADADRARRLLPVGDHIGHRRIVRV